MTRRKTAKTDATPTQARAQARVRVRVSFNGMRKGDEADIPWSDLAVAYVALGYLEVIDGGTDPAGQGGAEPDDAQRVPDGAEGGVPAGGEPGQDFGAGPYGSPA